MRLVIDGFGKFVGKENELIVVKERGKVVRRVKPDELRQVVITGKASISSDAINLMLKNAVDVVFLDRRGEVVGRLMHPFVGTAKTRREQYLAYNDKRSVTLAKEFVIAKLRNQISVLTNLAKARKDSKPEIAEKLMNARDEIKSSIDTLNCVSGDKIEDVRGEILGIEGNASQVYWNSLSLIFPQEYGFKGRRGLEAGQTRYAQDIVNAMLNYGYAILHSECIRAVELAGLDPYAGFLHADRSGRTSIALDLMEEFRQQIVDRAVIKLVSYRQIKPADCEMRNFVCMLNDSARRILLGEVLKRLETKTQYMGRNMSYSSVILQQARRIASFLRKEKNYMDADRTYMHTAEAVRGYFFITFLAMRVYFSILKRLREEGLTNRISVNEALFELSKVTLIKERSGREYFAKIPKRAKRILSLFPEAMG